MLVFTTDTLKFLKKCGQSRKFPQEKIQIRNSHYKIEVVISGVSGVDLHR